MHDVGVQAVIKGMLAVDRELEYVSLEFRQIGTDEHPLIVSPSRTMGLVRARALRLACRHECHVQVERGAPLAWRHFKLISGALVALDFDGCLDFVHSLQDFEIFCRAFCGPGCVELTQALALLGRNVHSGGGRSAWWLNSFGSVTKDFDQVMLCGCHACLSCLKANAKLPEGSTLPDDHQLQRCWAYP